MVTRLREDLSIDSNEVLPLSPRACNKGVISDERITLASSKAYWRLVTYRSDRVRVVRLLTNDFDLQAGEVAFLSSRRWEDKKALGVWKNDFAMAKARGKSKAAITNQLLLAVTTGVLLALFLNRFDAGDDEKSIKKQRDLVAGKDGGTEKSAWSEGLYGHTTRLSKQVLRFFRCCDGKRMSSELIEEQLKPLLQCYI